MSGKGLDNVFAWPIIFAFSVISCKRFGIYPAPSSSFVETYPNIDRIPSRVLGIVNITIIININRERHNNNPMLLLMLNHFLYIETGVIIKAINKHRIIPKILFVK